MSGAILNWRLDMLLLQELVKSDDSTVDGDTEEPLLLWYEDDEDVGCVS